MRFSFKPESEAAVPKPEYHLKEGVPAIMACIGTPEEFRESTGPEAGLWKYASDIPEADNVDYHGHPDVLVKQNFKNRGKDSYVISPIDSLDKFSRSFVNCTGLLVVGCDKKTGENISFLSHEYPEYFLDSKTNRNSFLSDLRERLAELKERCGEGTIDAAIVGGNYFTTGRKPKDFQKDYLESIELLSAETAKALGFEPVVMTGPKVISGGEDVFYENKTRRLHILRPEVGDSSTESFAPGAAKDQEKKWRSDASQNGLF